MLLAATGTGRAPVWRESLGMSLVGSLEDLGLGDILQIIHLSGKSGALLLRCEAGDGQILFERGLVRAATTRDAPQTLRELLANRKALPADALASASQEARKSGATLTQVLVQRGLLTEDAIEELRASAIGDAVIHMFGWRGGEFSFEVRESPIGSDELAIARGINPQFLALEGTRHEDEQSELGAGGGEGAEEEAEEPTLEAQSAGVEEPPEEEVLEALPVAEDEPAEEEAAGPGPAPAQSAAELPLEQATQQPQPEPDPEVAATALPAQPPPIVVIDPSLAVLEWTKAALTGHARVHTFQHTELGIQRIRQYLLRRELPIAILSSQAPPDPVSGARDAYDVTARLRRQAPRIQVLITSSEGTKPPARSSKRGAAPNAFADRPKDAALTDPRRGPERMQLAAALREVIERLAKADAGSGPPAKKSKPGPESELARLRETTGRMRERARQGEVLSQVLAFAAQSFSRVALFMVRDEQVVGMAQIGLTKAGGPDDAALRDLQLGSAEPAWFRNVLETRRPVRSAPSDDGDRRLCAMLGSEIPAEALVAPLESANRVVAILYADNLPGRRPLGDTGALEVVLDQAGLALDRTLLERALVEAGVKGENPA